MVLSKFSTLHSAGQQREVAKMAMVLPKRHFAVILQVPKPTS
jgi:hypothetical protein